MHGGTCMHRRVRSLCTVIAAPLFHTAAVRLHALTFQCFFVSQMVYKSIQSAEWPNCNLLLGISQWQWSQLTSMLQKKTNEERGNCTTSKNERVRIRRCLTAEGPIVYWQTISCTSSTWEYCESYYISCQTQSPFTETDIPGSDSNSVRPMIFGTCECHYMCTALHTLMGRLETLLKHQWAVRHRHTHNDRWHEALLPI